MVSLFDRIKIFLGMKASAPDKTEPAVNQPAEVQSSTLKDNNVSSGDILTALVKNDILPEASELPKQTEDVNVQNPELKHASELERLKQYAELIKQNRLNSNELNEDLD
jgi:hypothetical protein